VIQHALKVDFWDIHEMTNKIVNVLKHPPLWEELRENSTREVQKFNLDEPARNVIDVYSRAIKSKN
jgi:glycosyltransferase involved in cell wall biosynthesis